MLAQWEEIKREVEGDGEREPLAGLPENLPALLYARKVLRRVDPDAEAAGLWRTISGTLPTAPADAPPTISSLAS